MKTRRSTDDSLKPTGPHISLLRCHGVILWRYFLIRIVAGFASLWLRMCNWSITLTAFIHILLSGLMNGSSHFATFNPSTWHMLSYATIVLDICSKTSAEDSPASKRGLNFLYIHRISTRKACVGDSDLEVKLEIVLAAHYSFLYNLLYNKQ